MSTTGSAIAGGASATAPPPFLGFFLFFFALPAGTKSSFSQSSASPPAAGGEGASLGSGFLAFGFFLFFFALAAGTKSSFSQSSASAGALAAFAFCFSACALLPPLAFFFLFALLAGTKSSFSQSRASPARVGPGAARTGRRAAAGRASAARPAPTPEDRAPRPVASRVAKGATARAGTAAMAAPVNIFAPCALPSHDERETGVLSRRSSLPRAGRCALRQCALTSPPSRFGDGQSPYPAVVHFLGEAPSASAGDSTRVEEILPSTGGHTFTKVGARWRARWRRDAAPAQTHA